MVHYFYFVRDIGHPSVDTVVYRVKVGTSQREQIKFALVREFCRDCGLYFERVSDASDSAIRQLEFSLFTGFRRYASPLRRATVSISELFTLINDDSFAWFESNLTEKKGTFSFLSNIDPVFFAANHRKKINQSLPAPARKYLKSEQENDWVSFLVSSITVAIIFLIAGYLEGRFVYGL